MEDVPTSTTLATFSNSDTCVFLDRPSNDTDGLDDTMPIEVLESIISAAESRWLSKDMPIATLSKQANSPVPSLLDSDEFRSGGSSAFNPPMSSTQVVHDSSSSGKSCTVSAEFGSDIDITKNNGYFKPSFDLMPAASVEFQPIRCSTAVTINDANSKGDSGSAFAIRCDTTEFKPLRFSTALKDLTGPENVPPLVESSLEFSPLRWSTDVTQQTTGSNALPMIPNDVEVRPSTPEAYLTACCLSCDSSQNDGDTKFFTARGNLTQTIHCKRSSLGKLSPRTESSGSSSPKSEEDDDSSTEKAMSNESDGIIDVNDDLSILMQCHLRIRNGRQVISNIQTKPQVEFSVFKGTPSHMMVSKSHQNTGTPFSPVDVNVAGRNRQQQVNIKVQPKIEATRHRCGESGLLKFEVPAEENRTSLRLSQKNEGLALPPPPIFKQSSVPTDRLALGNVSGNVDAEIGRGTQDAEERPLREPENRLQRALENLTSVNTQRVTAALGTLDSAKSDLLCEHLVELGCIDRIYDFLSKMNRSYAHQVAAVHATSLLLDLAKFSFSSASAWQNGSKIGLLLNLMSIWVSKDNAIFLNCATLLWVFSRDQSRANVIRRFVGSQNKVLEKVSLKLNIRTQRHPAAVKTPVLAPSWTNGGLRRTFDSPSGALSALLGVLKDSQNRVK